MKRLMTGGLGAALLLTALSPLAQLKPEDNVKYRKAGYQFMAWNMGKIKAQVVDGSEPYKKEQVVAAANAIAAIANSGMGALFPPGTAADQLGTQTRLKPEFFKNLDDANKLARNFTGAVDKLASEAASGDQARIKTAFGEAAKTCKACHDQFRTD